LHFRAERRGRALLRPRLSKGHASSCSSRKEGKKICDRVHDMTEEGKVIHVLDYGKGSPTVTKREARIWGGAKGGKGKKDQFRPPS